MTFRKSLYRYLVALRKGLGILAAPVKGDSGRGGLFIQAYNGFGSRRRVFLMGRVFHQPGFGSTLREDKLRRDFVDLVRRLLRKPVAGAQVRVRYKDTNTVVTSDRRGFFRVDMDLGEMPSDVTWHSVQLSLAQPTDDRATTTGEFFTPTSAARYGVISDIDDTVVFTGVANTAKMMFRLFAQGAESRVVFPGVTALYQGFHAGSSGDEGNPLFYVSRGPWSIYQVLVEMFRMHGIPNGPILILREWGMKRGSLMPRRVKDHKRDAIRHIMSVYPDLSFILIGDSGQRDPELYAEMLRAHPGRIPAIYIRNVSDDPARSEAIRALAREALESDCELILADDNAAMAEHAAERGFVGKHVPAQVHRQSASE